MSEIKHFRLSTVKGILARGGGLQVRSNLSAQDMLLDSPLHKVQKVCLGLCVGRMFQLR